MSIISLSDLLIDLQTKSTTHDMFSAAPKNQNILGYPDDHRILISTKNTGPNLLDAEASGVVVDTSTWTILTRPPTNISHIYTGIGRLTLGADQSEYSCWKIRDGTFVTLYWYNNKWNIGSRNSVNLAGKKWVGDKTYLDVLREALARVGASLTGADSATTLNRAYSYSIGFCHPDYHPAETAPDVWLVQMYDITAERIISTPELLSGAYPTAGIPLYLPEDLAGADVLAWNDAQLEADPAYCGFILRPTESAEHTETWIGKSSRLKSIEKAFYNVIRAPTAHQKARYAALYSCRLATREKEFAELFPGLAGLLAQAQDAIHAFTSSVHSALLNGIPSHSGYVNQVCAELRHSAEISPSSANAHSLIRDTILERLGEDLRVIRGIFAVWPKK